MNYNAKPHQKNDGDFLIYKRRISLEDDFMNYNTNDLLYAFMRTLSTAHPINPEATKYEEYLPIKSLTSKKKVIAELLGVSTRTINNHIEKLKQNGLIKEDCRAGSACYLFPYSPKGKYKLIEKDMLEYLIDTRSAHAIRTYIYLLDKFEWKKQEQDYYYFTVKELRMAFGYSENYKNLDITFTHILESLKREGIISYEEIYDMSDNNTHVIPRKKLINVVKNKKDLK